MKASPTEFQNRLYHEIPMAAYMRVCVEACSATEAKLSAPLMPNINHKQTAFGGSVHSLAVLACWSLVTQTLDELERENLFSDYVVIQDSKIDYTKPIATDFTAVARWGDEQERNRFITGLRKRGLARASLEADVFNAQNLKCASLTGRFAARVASAKS